MAWNSYPGSALTVTAEWKPAEPKYPTSYATQKEMRRMGFYGTAYLLDGKFGPTSIRELQKYLAKYGKYAGKYTGRIDGVMGDMTLSAMSCFIGFDGGNPWGIVTNTSTVGPTHWPDYNLTRDWQQFLNKRR